MPRIKALILTSPNPIGTGGQVRNFYVLRELARKKHIEATLVADNCPSSVIRLFEDLGFNVLKVKGFSQGMETEQYLIGLLKVFNRFESEQYDVIVSQSEHPKYVCAACVLHRLLKAPWTSILQSFLWLSPLRYGLSVPTILRTSLAIKMLNETLVHVVSESIPYMLREQGVLLRYYSVLDIPAGLDWELLDEARRYSSEKQYDIAYMARISSGKGALDLIYVVYRLKRLGFNPKVLVLGRFEDEDLERRFIAYVRSLGLAGNFELVGFLTGIEKYVLLARSKIFLYPSRIDAFPLSLLEALGLGLPSVTFDVPFTYQFRDAVFIARDREEMVRYCSLLLSDEGLRDSAGKRALSFARRYTWEAAALSEYKAYLETIKWFVENGA